MGACDFTTLSSGGTASGAFNAAVEQAQYDYGHAGYTGTIAEKDDFTEIPFTLNPNSDKSPAHQAQDFANRLMDEDDERVMYKWGPAGCKFPSAVIAVK